MVSVSVRSLLVPGVALATAGVVAMGPTLVAPPAVTIAQPMTELPAVHIADIQLAGIGREFYNDVTFWVQEGVAWAAWGVSTIPYIGPPIADQININYFGLLQPVIANTVYYVSDVFADPFNFIGLTGLYGSNLFYTGYNWASLQAQFFGLAPFFPIPKPLPLAAVNGSSAPLAVGRAAASVRAAVAEAPAVADAPVEDAAVPDAQVADVAVADAVAVEAPARAARGQAARSARSAVAAAAQAARSAAAEVPAAAQQVGAEVSAAAQTAASEVRSTSRSARGAVAKAASQASDAAQAATG